MYIANVITPVGGSVVSLKFPQIAVRKITLMLPHDGCVLNYNGKTLIRTCNYQSTYMIDFSSYHGFPDASKFNLVNYGDSDFNATVLIDTVPEMPINPDYFIQR